MATYYSIDFNVHKSFHNICTVPQYNLLFKCSWQCSTAIVYERAQHEDTPLFNVAETQGLQRGKGFFKTTFSSMKINKTLEKATNDQDLTLPYNHREQEILEASESLHILFRNAFKKLGEKNTFDLRRFFF